MDDVALHTAIEAGEQQLIGTSAALRRRRAAALSGVPVHSAVPIASVCHGWLTGRGSISARPFPAHSIVTGIVTLGRLRTSSRGGSAAYRRARRSQAAIRARPRPGCRNARDVVHARRRDRIPQPLERHAVIAQPEVHLFTVERPRPPRFRCRRRRSESGWIFRAPSHQHPTSCAQASGPPSMSSAPPATSSKTPSGALSFGPRACSSRLPSHRPAASSPRYYPRRPRTSAASATSSTRHRRCRGARPA